MATSTKLNLQELAAKAGFSVKEIEGIENFAQTEEQALKLLTLMRSGMTMAQANEAMRQQGQYDPAAYQETTQDNMRQFAQNTAMSILKSYEDGLEQYLTEGLPLVTYRATNTALGKVVKSTSNLLFLQMKWESRQTLNALCAGVLPQAQLTGK